MRIALVIDDNLDSVDGVQQYVLTLGSWLSAQGHDVHYISSHTKREIPQLHELSPSVKVRFNKNKLRVPLPASPKRIQTLINRGNFDVVHVQMPFSPQLAGRLIRGLPDTTGLVGTFHILPFGRLQTTGGSLLAWWVRPMLRRFDDVIAVSKPAGDHARDTYGVAKSWHIPNTVQVDSFRANGTAVVPGRVVFLGRLVPRKGVMELLKAVRLLRKTHLPHNFHLFIVGSGPERPKLEAYTQRHKLDGVVSFEGFVTEERKRELLSSAQISIFPSTGGESFGIVLLEAMAAGSEVVLAGDNPGYVSVLGSIPEALINPGEPKQLADKLAGLLSDEAARKRIYAKQQALINQYDIDVVGPKIVHIYIQAIEKRRGSAHTKVSKG